MTDEALLGLLATEEDRLSRAAVDEIVSRDARMIGPLTQIVTDPETWQADLPAWWAPIHATFILGAIGGPGAIEGLLAAAKWSDAYDVGWVFEVLPSIFGRLGTTARPLLQWLQEARHPPFVRSLVAQGLAATTLNDLEGAGEVYRQIGAVFSESDNDDLKDLLGNVLLDFQVAEYKDVLTEYARRREAETRSKFFLAFSVDDVEQAFSRPFPVGLITTRRAGSTSTIRRRSPPARPAGPRRRGNGRNGRPRWRRLPGKPPSRRPNRSRLSGPNRRSGETTPAPAAAERSIRSVV